MSIKRIKWLALLLFVMGLPILLSACVGASQQSSPPEQRNYPTLFITPMITQVIATRSAPTPTPEEEATPTQFMSSSYDPLKAKIYYPIRGCVASRLHIGDSAFVATNSGQMGIYPSKDINFAPIIRYADAGEAFLITDGPWCQGSTLIWKVRTTDDDDSNAGSGGSINWVIENYAPEGNGELYWLLPLETNPGIATPKPTQSQAYFFSFPKGIKGCGGRR